MDTNFNRHSELDSESTTRHSEQSEESLEKYQREYLYDEFEVQQEIDRLEQQYEIYMEQAI